MRNFLLILSVVLLGAVASGCTQCSNDVPWGVEYSLSSDGRTDDTVTIDFVNGHFTLDGAAAYSFDWSNAPEPDSVVVKSAKPLADVLRAADPTTLEAAQYVDKWLTDSIKVSDFEGYYNIYVRGYVKETKTQITFSINRHFSNLPE